MGRSAISCALLLGIALALSSSTTPQPPSLHFPGRAPSYTPNPPGSARCAPSSRCALSARGGLALWRATRGTIALRGGGVDEEEGGAGGQLQEVDDGWEHGAERGNDGEVGGEGGGSEEALNLSGYGADNESREDAQDGKESAVTGKDWEAGDGAAETTEGAEGAGQGEPEVDRKGLKPWERTSGDPRAACSTVAR